METLLSATDLRIGLTVAGRSAYPVDGVSLQLARGELLGLVGESGSGKTMLSMAISGLLAENAAIVSGGLQLAGQEVTTLSPAAARALRRETTGVIFQNPVTALNPRLTLGAQLREALPARFGRTAAADRRCIELLDQVGIANPATRLADYPHEISGGQAQRIVIAMALAREPRLLVADEPTTALDVSIQAQILDLIDRLRREMRLGVLLVTHDIGLAAERADRIAVMYAGRIVETARAAQVLTSARHQYARALIASSPALVPAGWRIDPIRGTPPTLAAMPAGCRFAPRCARATEACRTTTPVWQGTVRDGFACLLPGPGADGVARTAHPRPSSAPDMPEAILTARGVSQDYPLPRNLPWQPRRSRSAVSDVSLTLQRGQALGIVGESGCGKTTMGRMLAGLLRPTAGQIAWRGRPLGEGGAPEWRRAIQYVHQDSYAALDPRLTVAELVAEPLRYRDRLRRAARTEAALRLLDEVGLSRELATRRPDQLSGGQRQRVNIARALSVSPEILITDESVSALDVSAQATILNLLIGLGARRGLSYVFISHDLGVVRYVCTHVAVMYLGVVVESGPVEQVLTAPRHPYTRALIDAAPSIGRAASDTPRLRLGGELPSPDAPPSGCRFRTRCPRATSLCAQLAPQFAAVAPDHSVACHMPLPGPEAGQPNPSLPSETRHI